MRQFYKLAEGLEVWPVLHQLARNEDLWNANRFRTEFPGTPHADADDIIIRFSDTATLDTTTRVMGDTRPVWHPAAAKLPALRPIINALMSQVNAYELGRVLIARLRPGGRILPHADNEGDYVHAADIARYHVVLQGLPGCLFHCGTETVQMRTGEVWWFNAHEVHSVENNSTDDRIHLLVDVRTW